MPAACVMRALRRRSRASSTIRRAPPTARTATVCPAESWPAAPVTAMGCDRIRLEISATSAGRPPATHTPRTPSHRPTTRAASTARPATSVRTSRCSMRHSWKRRDRRRVPAGLGPRCELRFRHAGVRNHVSRPRWQRTQRSMGRRGPRSSNATPATKTRP